ncbi:hypothetical protein CCHR01_06959 [Colletotrichum chrysophilum]|uniref:Uncharacterized protein n=1 Tax=Colletotrichum chrysophilum TaxID=1836956 RepID=A0AAD9EK59_9PEZI|nr:hypothetical protein CCHR01_06959 [Colletotrichum chrysophilum]
MDAPRGPAMYGAGHLGCGIMSLSLRALILYGSHWTNGRNGTMAEVTDHAGAPLSSRCTYGRTPFSPSEVTLYFIRLNGATTSFASREKINHSIDVEQRTIIASHLYLLKD